MERDDILRSVRHAIAESCGIPEERIEPTATLFQELGITSIDLVDVLFTLESEFDIELRISDIEARSRSALQDAPFEINGVITAEGREMLRHMVPEIPADRLVEGLTMHDIVNLVTVEILCRLVVQKLAETAA
jgi:acyl carrier protein